MKQKLLEEGDVIRIKNGHCVYAEIPERLAYSNMKQSSRMTRSEAKVSGELSYLAGEYTVYKTATEGGGTGHGPWDVYPDGHHVYAERNDGTKIDFYQTGCFTAMIPRISPVGKSVRKWLRTNQ